MTKHSNWFMNEAEDMYIATFRAYGNVDHGEDPNRLVCLPLEVRASNIGDIVDNMQAYIKQNNLGAGNMSTVTVTRNDRIVAKIFYNGRIQYVD